MHALFPGKVRKRFESVCKHFGERFLFLGIDLALYSNLMHYLFYFMNECIMSICNGNFMRDSTYFVILPLHNNIFTKNNITMIIDKSLNRGTAIASEDGFHFSRQVRETTVR